MSFSDIPIRSNSDTASRVEASWWNIIRTKLLEAFPVVNSNQLAPFTIANNISSYTDVTGAIFLPTEYTTWVLRYEVYRKTDASERLESGVLVLSYKPIATTYSVYRQADNDEDALNIADSLYVTALGQLQYKSDNMSGASYVGKFSYSVVNAFKGGL